MSIELNPQFQAALDLFEKSNDPILITGKAGTGKSTLLKHFRLNTNKNIVVLAPTGVAALNVGGETIHSFFSLPPNPHPEDIRRKQLPTSKLELLWKLDAIVIDEVSMVRADVLDFADIRLRKALHIDLPFGGLQVIMIGDLYQLPPVLTTADKDSFLQEYESPYFFASKVMQEVKLQHLELTKIYRQQDKAFVDVLNRIRNNSATPADLEVINSRFDEDYIAELDDFTIYLATTNKIVDQVNAYKLNELPDEKRAYKAAESGNFPPSARPNSNMLELKVGAQVMFLNNQKEEGSSDYTWVNGTLGKIINIIIDENSLKHDILEVELVTGAVVEVLPYTWKLEKYNYDAKAEKVMQQTEGTYTQYPLKLAWALTIHKAQGQTFERLIIDFGNFVFDYGQVYVALSRAVTLEGINLRRAINLRDIKVDRRVKEFLETL